jgi:XTP/dITP diphosphohydrolase
MKTLIFASGNDYKIREVRQLLAGKYAVKGLTDIGCTYDIPETSDTFEGNALLKAQYVVDQYHTDCFAEDTGLEVEALHGAPGVYSARFAGLHKSSADNMALLLERLKDQPNRKARFKTIVALVWEGKTHYFEGIVNGQITETPRGAGTFGYDPLFVPDGYHLTFAEMGSEIKNKISHRGRAIQELLRFLEIQ